MTTHRLLGLLLTLAVATTASAEIFRFKRGVDSNWENPSNWLNKKEAATRLPGEKDGIRISGTKQALILKNSRQNPVSVKSISVGQGGTQANLTVDGSMGGTLTIKDDLVVGVDRPSHVVFSNEVSVSVGGDFIVGLEDTSNEPSVVNCALEGGMIEIAGALKIGYQFTKKEAPFYEAILTLEGGSIKASDLWIARDYGGAVYINVKGGKLILEGDKRSTIEKFVSAGYITAYMGSPEYVFTLSFDEDSSETTLEVVAAEEKKKKKKKKKREL